MRNSAQVLLPALIVCASVASACMNREPAPVCPVPTELAQNDAMVIDFEGVDMAVVVDNSGSMAEEQEILSTAFFPLVNSLTNPLPGWQYPAADNVRIAVVSSDMGLQWGGKEYEAGDGWPGDNIPCTPAGDNGKFRTYGSGKTIDIQHDKIPCGMDAAQCPTGWSCSATEQDEIGLCLAPDGDGSDQECPGLAATWAETTTDAGNPELAFQVACLSSLGTDGCGFEQQLQAAAKGLTRGDQQEFIRDDALLSVLVVSDEEDCSIEDGPGLFASAEIQDQGDGRINIACGENEQFLYSMDDYRQTFIEAKNGNDGAVVFAAIVGVPPGSECEGAGHEIDQCLEVDEMQNVEVVENEAYFYRPACTRQEGDVEVTKARPGRRYVELAQQFNNMGYVYSICNADWSPAMEDVANLIAGQMAGSCFTKPLAWDPDTRTAKCDMVAEYIDVDECPFPVEDGIEPLVESYTDGDDVDHTITYCPLPRLAVPRSCDDLDEAPTEFGWYYCENFGAAAENFPEVCADGLDNDGNGLADCDDDLCQTCDVCGGNGVGCEQTCRYVVQLTDAGKDAVRGQSMSIQCLQQFEFTDHNCMEDTRLACNDDRDNDGNGVFDCDADSGDQLHAPDPACCPMTVDDEKSCVIDEAVYDNCPDSSSAELPDACVAAAMQLGCKLEA